MSRVAVALESFAVGASVALPLVEVVEQLVEVGHESDNTASGLGERTLQLVGTHWLRRFLGPVLTRLPGLVLSADLSLAQLEEIVLGHLAAGRSPAAEGRPT